MKEENVSVAKAASRFGVPAQTLRDRVLGKVRLEVVASGTHPALDHAEEATLMEHLLHVGRRGITFSRQDITDIASDYAFHIGKRPLDKPLTLNWYRKFVTRWPQIRQMYPLTVNTKNCKVLPFKGVTNYFDELHQILLKYDLMQKPHFIFNVDELTITQDCVSSHICVETDFYPPAENTDHRQFATIIGSGSASGMSLPPYFMFKDSSLIPETLTQFAPGAACNVSAGLSLFEDFKCFLEYHFLRWIPKRPPSQHILLLLDGHKSHMSFSLLEWAKSKNIVMLFIPGDSSHLLQPLDVGCYQHFQLKFLSKCRKTLGKMKTLHEHFCQPACQLYSQSLSAKKLKHGFSKTGVYPYSRSVLCEENGTGEEPMQRCSDEQKEIHMGENPELCVDNQEEMDENEQLQVDSVQGEIFVEEKDKHAYAIIDVEQEGELPVGTQHIIELNRQATCIDTHVVHLAPNSINIGHSLQAFQVIDMGVQHEVQISMQQEMDIGAQQEIGLEETG